MRPWTLLPLLVGCIAPDGEIETHTLDAVAVDQRYTLTVFEPDGKGPYDVVLLFDGGDWTDTTARIVTRLARDGEIEAPLIVGVGYGDGPNKRARDYTPDAPGIPDGHGGIEPFFEFVEGELVPWIDGRYPTTAEREGRVLLGHSFGGLAAAWGLLHANETFGASVPLSASLAFGDGVLFEDEAAYAQTEADLPVRVHLGAGSLEAYGLVGLTEAFHDALDGRDYPGLDLQLGIEPNRVHSDLFPVGAEAGLVHALGGR